MQVRLPVEVTYVHQCYITIQYTHISFDDSRSDVSIIFNREFIFKKNILYNI